MLNLCWIVRAESRDECIKDILLAWLSKLCIFQQINMHLKRKFCIKCFTCPTDAVEPILLCCIHRETCRSSDICWLSWWSMTWKHFPLYWPFVRGIPSPQRASLQSRGALKSFWYSVIWDAVRLMWCHCNMLSEPWAIENWYCEGPRKFDKGHLSLFTNLKWNQYISLVNEWFTQSMCCQFSLTSQNWRIC